MPQPMANCFNNSFLVAKYRRVCLNPCAIRPLLHPSRPHLPLYCRPPPPQTIPIVMKHPLTKKPLLPFVLACFFLAGTSTPLPAQQANHPSIPDLTAGVLKRIQHELATNELLHLTVTQAERFITPPEREILANEHITFNVNVPVRVTVLRDVRLGDEPFWLRERGFQPTPVILKQGRYAYDTWQKGFPAGRVGLGIHCFRGDNNHYFVALAPQHAGDKLEVTDLYPKQLQLATLTAGVQPYVDEADKLASVPPELEGQLLIRTDTDLEVAAKLLGVFHTTQYPASERPDQIILTWSDDPRTSQTIQWRTSTRVNQGYVRYQKKTDSNAFDPKSASRAGATTTPLETPRLLNDPLVHRHTAVLRDLTPDTTYLYSVGDGSDTGWSQPAEFTTAPAAPKAFSFIYMGDAQNGLDQWGALLHESFKSHPEAAFYVMAGDLINHGSERSDYDSFFHNAAGVYDHRTLMPTIGNHECQWRGPELFLRQYTLPHNGPTGIEPNRAYWFEYGNALFLVPDSNLPPESQAAWMENKLSHSNAKWKFVLYHHPAYSSGGNADNPELRAAWIPLFDKYHVDLALQGHDHAYLRTYPMRANQRVASPKDGTIYLITVSGTKGYEQPKHDYIEFGMTKVPTYQVINLDRDGHRLTYRAYDIHGTVRDEFVIEK